MLAFRHLPQCTFCHTSGSTHIPTLKLSSQDLDHSFQMGRIEQKAAQSLIYKTSSLPIGFLPDSHLGHLASALMSTIKANLAFKITFFGCYGNRNGWYGNQWPKVLSEPIPELPPSQFWSQSDPRNHSFLVSMAANWLPWKPVRQWQFCTPPRRSCQVWCPSAHKRWRRCGTNKPHENSNYSMMITVFFQWSSMDLSLFSWQHSQLLHSLHWLITS